MREHLYSMSVVIVTIIGGMGDTHYAIMNHKGVAPGRDAFHFNHIGHFRV